MTKCVYNTDRNWFEYLRTTGTAGPVNFWRFDKRSFHLSLGSTFYFRIRGTRFIAGEAQYQGLKRQTAGEAWDEFGFANGANSRKEFIDAIGRVLGVSLPSEQTEITSMILDHCIWYPDEMFCEIDAKVFPPTIMAAKFFDDSELTFLPLHRLPSSGLIDDDGYYENNSKLVSHQQRERSAALVKKVKAEREWICEICDEDYRKKYGRPFIDAHHKVPLAWRGSGISRPEDIALLCPSCHVAIHKYMKRSQAETFDTLRIRIINALSK